MRGAALWLVRLLLGIQPLPMVIVVAAVVEAISRHAPQTNTSAAINASTAQPPAVNLLSFLQEVLP